MVCRSIFTNKSGSVQTQYYVLFINSQIVYNVVVSTLHERRIDVAERHHTLLCQSSGKCNGMSFGDTYIKSPVGHFFHQVAHGAPGRHGRSNSYDFRILFGKLYQCMPKYILKQRRHSFGIGNNSFSGFFVEDTRSMPYCRCFFCRLKSFSFDGMDMKKLRTFHFFDIVQGLDKSQYIMAVYRSKVAYVESFKNILLLG